MNFKGWFAKGRKPPTQEPPSPAAPFSGARSLQPSENPWGVPILDVSPATMHMMATSKDPVCAANLASLRGDDGTSFIGVEPRVATEVAVGLRFPIDRVLADGALFIPTEMEHKWGKCCISAFDRLTT